MLRYYGSILSRAIRKIYEYHQMKANARRVFLKGDRPAYPVIVLLQTLLDACIREAGGSVFVQKCGTTFTARSTCGGQNDTLPENLAEDLFFLLLCLEGYSEQVRSPEQVITIVLSNEPHSFTVIHRKFSTKSDQANAVFGRIFDCDLAAAESCSNEAEAIVIRSLH